MRYQARRQAAWLRLPAASAILLAGWALAWGAPPETGVEGWDSFRHPVTMASTPRPVRLNWVTRPWPAAFDDGNLGLCHSLKFGSCATGSASDSLLRQTEFALAAASGTQKISVDTALGRGESEAPLARGQSPDVSLLPLARGAAPVETTSGLGQLVTPLVIGNGRLGGTYVTDFDETDKIGVQILTQGGLGAGIDAEVNYWRRPVPGIGREPLWTGDVNMMYGLSPISRFKLRAGAGGSWMVNDGQTHYGYNLTYGVDVYMLWRLMFTGEVDYGKIDSDELLRYRAGLGLTFNRLDLFTGYESQKIGDERLDGWMGGVALWY